MPTTEFSRELSRAIAARGLGLQRLREHLIQRGLSVSVATLSYWSNGHVTPRRAASLPVITELERILELAPGTLIDTLEGQHPALLEWSRERDARLKEILANTDLPRSMAQELLLADVLYEVDERRLQHRTTTTLVTRALAADQRGWTVTFDRDEGQSLEAADLHGLRMGRRIDVDEQFEIIEFLFDPPLDNGEVRRTSHVLEFVGSTTECTSAGYACRRATSLMAIAVRFAGEPPRRVWQSHLPIEPGAEAQRGPEIAPAPLVECILASPAPGLHSLMWEW